MLAAAIKKDFQLLVRDRGALVTMFLLPIAFIAVFGSIFGGSGDDRRPAVAVYAAPESRPAQAAQAALVASGMFELSPVPSPQAARNAVAEEEVDAAVILLPGFDPAAGRPGELAIDLAAPIQVRAPLVGALQAIVSRAVFPPAPGAELPVLVAASPPGIRSALRDVSAFQLTVPGNAVLFGFFLALTVGLSFTEERKWGTWRRILAAPVSRGTILLAKLVPYFVMGLLQFAFLFGLGIVVFGMRVGGSPLALVTLTVAVVACAVALGLVIAAVGGSEKRMGSIGSVCLLVMGLLGGSMVPRAIMPPLLQQLGLAVPHAWALDGYLEVLVREGAGIADVAPQLGALLGFTALFFAVGLARFRFER